MANSTDSLVPPRFIHLKTLGGQLCATIAYTPTNTQHDNSVHYGIAIVSSKEKPYNISYRTARAIASSRCRNAIKGNNIKWQTYTSRNSSNQNKLVAFISNTSLGKLGTISWEHFIVIVNAFKKEVQKV